MESSSIHNMFLFLFYGHGVMVECVVIKRGGLTATRSTTVNNVTSQYYVALRVNDIVINKSPILTAP